MGGGTFVDGVRRWFSQKKGVHTTSSSSSVTSFSSANEKDLTPFEQIRERDQEQQLKIEIDFDLSGLRFIKVPKRLDFPRSSSSPSAMPLDHQKKV